MVRIEPAGSPMEMRSALASPQPSVRLTAALHAGSRPHAEYVEPLVLRCAVEPDFYVRDMLTWALLQQDREAVVHRVLSELDSDLPQARSQALHTLSKIGDPAVWPAITSDLLFDIDDEVARTAWRTAVGLVPAGSEAALARQLATQFGRGDRDVLMSLSRCLVALGDGAVPVVEQALTSSNEVVRAHAAATARLRRDPEAGFDDSVEAAKRVRSMRGAPMVQE